jgi:hypothetical protein
LLFSTDNTQLESELSSGVCQVFSGWDFYDLKNFDGIGTGRDVTKKTAARLTITSGDIFLYKTC